LRRQFTRGGLELENILIESSAPPPSFSGENTKPTGAIKSNYDQSDPSPRASIGNMPACDELETANLMGGRLPTVHCRLSTVD
jgi:hypothetical protein